MSENTTAMAITTPADIPLPSAYKELGLTTGYNPVALADARLYITGLSGQGKSTFISSIPDAWVLDFEGGVDGVPGRRGAYFDLKAAAKKAGKSKFDVYRMIMEKLIADGEAGKHPCKRVIFDTHDEWVAFESSNLLREKSSPTKIYENIGEYGQKGHGHSMVQNRCKRRLSDLDNAGYTWAVVGHLTYVVETDISGKEKTVLRAVLSKGYVAPVRRLAEMHVTINSSTLTERVPTVYKTASGKEVKSFREQEVTKYSLFTRSNDSGIEGKQRGVADLPGRIEVPRIGGWSVLKKEYNVALEKEKERLSKP